MGVRGLTGEACTIEGRMIMALILSHLFAIAVGILLGAYRTAPHGRETEAGFELEVRLP
jgi:hypothetical protein